MRRSSAGVKKRSSATDGPALSARTPNNASPSATARRVRARLSSSPSPVASVPKKTASPRCSSARGSPERCSSLSLALASLPPGRGQQFPGRPEQREVRKGSGVVVLQLQGRLGGLLRLLPGRGPGRFLRSCVESREPPPGRVPLEARCQFLPLQLLAPAGALHA